VLSTGAVAWSAALVAVHRLCSGCTSQAAHTTATHVEMNGDVVLVIIAVLAGIAALGRLGLHRYLRAAPASA
jgi:hypothetical protein